MQLSYPRKVKEDISDDDPVIKRRQDEMFKLVQHYFAEALKHKMPKEPDIIEEAVRRGAKGDFKWFKGANDSIFSTFDYPDSPVKCGHLLHGSD
jgi:hypothetical protein